LATVSSSPTYSETAFPVPHVRTVIMRCLFGEIERHPSNTSKPNPDVFASDLPVFTTDVRMDKAKQLFEAGPRPGDFAISATGGGGPVEMTFWAPEPAVQWRLSGRAYLLGPDADDDTEAAKTVREEIRKHLRLKEGEADKEDGWSWAREVTAIFGNMSPQSRGWFRNPPPGTPVDQPLPDKRLGFGQKIDDLEDELARQNFRVVVVVPHEVDQVDLSDLDGHKRWRHRLLDGKWQTVEVWP